MQLGIHHYSLFAGLIVALLCYPRLKGSYMVWFIPFLAFVFATEMITNILYYGYGKPTGSIYNITILLQMIFYAYIFIRLAETKRHKQFLLFVSLFYMIGYCAYLTIAGEWKTVKQDLLLPGFIMLVVFACLFFYQCLRDDYDLSNQQYRTGLWIAAGVLIFYSGISICYSLISYIAKYDLRLHGKRLYNIIPQYLCILLYGCLSVSFILWKKPVKTS